MTKARDEVFQTITREFSCTLGKTTSKAERFEKGLNSGSLTYGEVEYLSLVDIFDVIKQDGDSFQEPGGVFVDLGSGIGKGVIGACLMHQFDRVIGIEILEGLYTKSCELKDVYYSTFPRVLEEEGNPFGFEKMPELELIHGDFLKGEMEFLKETDFVLANSTCFSEELMEQLAERLKEMKRGSWVVTFTKRLPDFDTWDAFKTIKKPMTWGMVTVNIHLKVK